MFWSELKPCQVFAACAYGQSFSDHHWVLGIWCGALWWNGCLLDVHSEDCLPSSCAVALVRHPSCSLVDRAYRNRETFQCGGLLDFIEFYGGVGNLSRELLLRCLNGATFDTMYRPVDHDCLGQGFRLWLDALCSTCEGALVWLGTQCSSFVALCASVSKRRLENQWMGDNGREFVQVGNCHMIITALIYFLATLLQCATCLEQPLNSCLPNCPLMASVLTFCNAIKVNTHLGSFGAETPKPLQIWTTCLELQDLWRPKPGNLPGTLVSKGPNGAFTGLKEPLQASGIYTRAFGAEVADLFLSSYRHQ